jgi:glucose/arabinose dehydrogenase
MPHPRLRAEPLEDRLTPVTLPPGFTESVFAAGLTGPTAMAVAPDGQVFVAEQGGTLRVVQNGTVLSTPFVSLAVDSAGERGLIGVALDPQFAANGFVYVHYTVPGSPAHNRVSRFTAAGNVAAAGSEFPVLDLDPLSGATNHNGGAIHFGPDGKLYVAVGDNATGANAQSLTNRLGKILRINADGTIPADNPAAIDGLGAVPAGPTRAIWAAGLRNPFTFTFDPAGRMLINDVGQSAFEEINPGRAGANYGWPQTEGTFDPGAFPAFTAPVYAYSHTGPHPFDGVAVVGGAFGPGSFPSDYAGDYLFSDLTGGWIDRLDAATGAVTNFADAPTGRQIVGLDTGPGGQLIYLARSRGAIYQITFGGPGALVAVGAGAGGGPTAKLFDLATGTPRQTVNAFAAGFTGGVRVAAADVTGDGVADLITGAGPGGGPDVRVYDGATGQQVRQFLAFEPSFTGGVYVAAGDIDGDGLADLIVSPDVGGGPRVRVLSGRDLSVLADFLGIADPNFRGGVRVAVGDVGGGDGVADLVVAAGVGGGPRVAVFDGATLHPRSTPARLFNDFFAFEPGLRDGTFVAAGDFDGDGRGDVVVGAGPGGAPRVVVFGGATLPTGGPDQSVIASFFAGSSSLRGGVPVGARNVDADVAAEILIGAGVGDAPALAVYKWNGGAVADSASLLAFDPTFTGGVFVG